MTLNYSTLFDQQIVEKISHLSRYPQMLPFIGSKWTESPRKVLLLGESHYIPGEELTEISGSTHLSDWYNNSSKDFYPGLADYIDTRGVVMKSDNVEEEGFEKPLTIFYNLKKEIMNSIEELKNEKFVFPYFSFYNYFQRPHFVEGDSIINDQNDNRIAYETLKELVNIIQPRKIIFVSTKAKTSFDSEYFRDETKELFESIKIDSVPHASSEWWNRVAEKYGNRTGREKFIELISAD